MSALCAVPYKLAQLLANVIVDVIGEPPPEGVVETVNESPDPNANNAVEPAVFDQAEGSTITPSDVYGPPGDINDIPGGPPDTV